MREAAFVRNPDQPACVRGFEWILVRHVLPCAIRPAENSASSIVTMLIVETDRGLSLLHGADLYDVMGGERHGPPQYVAGWVEGRPGDPVYRVTVHQCEPALRDGAGSN